MIDRILPGLQAIAVGRLSQVTPLSARALVPSTAPAGAGIEPFAETLGRALESVNTLQLEAEETAAQLASGKPVDMTKAVVTIEKASISLQFAIQVRNKLLEAYQEIMRMQV